ncbi:hypothetical protein SM11_pC1512 (plasmid) [Sinorhizobium meliloti SM11]|uniref:Uncharacterized protein n=1 Tax=Sinorhizobium meliloti (strain SM11) TaxID=707241 RepID=F7XBZ8_SINMM|nr:hypothetical protein SM11_pC1512 [Sinorhizobium meliloti SM11]
MSSRACGSQMATQDKRGGNGRNAGNGSYLAAHVLDTVD